MSDEMKALRTLSAKVGSDPLLVQAAGGNTSLKKDGVMWIKASGTWLRDAGAKDIFVPLDMPRLTAALAADDPACESCTDFVRQELNPSGLRPSIETSVHGLMPQKVVVHVHCVNTIAFAVQENGKALIGERLKDFHWAWVPYARPGLMLSRAIKGAIRPGVDVLVLGNHGLAVAADTVKEAEALLSRVVAAVQRPVRSLGTPDLAALKAKAEGTGYRLPEDPACHDIALDGWSCQHGCQNVYYPDHVVFLGTSIPQDATSGQPAISVPGAGVLVHKSAKSSVEPMLRCAGDVFRRLDPSARLKALSAAEIDQLLNWDAEKYRQTLNAN
ncbi:MAG: class II aldolase/adducin family protein [Proteobacteria bacterium]|nr:class II aldolase/adducin family protein [Pseudomonadota bacterium]